MNISLRIAVADDESFMRDYLRDTFTLLGHEVVAVAENGRELVDRCAATHPDVAVIDVNMPEKDGITAAAEIYDEHPLAIILISANYGPEFLQRARDSHVLAYLIKPVKRHDLVNALETALNCFGQLRVARRSAEQSDRSAAKAVY